MPSLFVISTDERYPLTPGEHIAGRLASCALTLNEAQASRRQFALRPAGTRWTVCDLGSRNGTSLNTQRLTETPVALHHGDRISVGETVIRYDVELETLAAGTELGGVTLGKRRGRSEYGTLYLGRQDALDRDVVVEVLDPDLAGDPEFVSSYQARARAAGAFEHPGVLIVLDVVAGETTYTVFEQVPGKSLAELWRSDTSFDRERALRVLLGLAEALSHVHARGRHHGLLTPTAVLVDERDRVKLRGLGEPANERLRPYARQTTVRGSYASPEEARGDPSGPASDLYSFGLLACRALSGELPFKVRKGDEAVALHASPDPLPLAGVDADLDVLDLLEQLLAKDPAQRPSFDVVRERLETALGRASDADEANAHTPPRLPPSARPGRGDAPPKRSKSARAGAGSGAARRRSTGRAAPGGTSSPPKRDSARLGKRDSARAAKAGSARAARAGSARAPKRDSGPVTAPQRDSARAPRTTSSAARKASSARVAPTPEPPHYLYIRLALVGVGYLLCFSAAILVARIARRLLQI